MLTFLHLPVFCFPVHLFILSSLESHSCWYHTSLFLTTAHSDQLHSVSSAPALRPLSQLGKIINWSHYKFNVSASAWSSMTPVKSFMYPEFVLLLFPTIHIVEFSRDSIALSYGSSIVSNVPYLLLHSDADVIRWELYLGSFLILSTPASVR